MWAGETKVWIFNAEKPPKSVVFLAKMVGVRGLEPRASYSQTFWENFFCLFLVFFSYFRSVSITLWRSQNLRSPRVPKLSVVINVVKNASRLKSVAFHRLRTGSVFAFQLGRIVTLTEWLCKGFFSCRAPQMLGGNIQRNRGSVILLSEQKEKREIVWFYHFLA